ncbi:MAG: hypothetical protein CML66_11910 [Rhodobacteraceae bacterium]|nr:hypothetical protein [Paracoccaceae bacterium]MAY45619.1 hypothetical protein [Paracoccaceae bacterium]QEW19504.1 hypothetical protein LA6_001694 [Marinibacterium anthonyi]
MRYLFLLLLAGMFLTARPGNAQPYTIFLLDLSRSMEFPVANQKRVDFAKRALVETFATGDYPASELIMWNTSKLREVYGNGPELSEQIMAAPKGDSGSHLGSAFLSISDAGYRCSHVVFVTDEYPDDVRTFQQAIGRLLQPGWQNAVTVYVVKHPESYYYADRFSDVSSDPRYRVVDGSRQGSLAAYLADNPVTDTCGTLS